MGLVLMIEDTLAEHMGVNLPLSTQCTPAVESSAELRPLSINVIYTEPDATIAALCAAERFAEGLDAAIQIRALVSVPHQFSLANPPISVSHLKQLLTDIIRRYGSTALTHFLHIYVCRNRTETLLRVLQPSSVLTIGGRRRLWPTPDTRLARVARAAGHS